jgi:N-acetyl-anhydromuramyl-L-alanine amidase AmpD
MKVNNPQLQFTGRLTPLNPANVRYIIVHHTAGQNTTAQDIHRMHISAGKLGAGYNEYIRLDGSVWIMRGDNVGAQTAGFNAVSYGIGCEGNYHANLREMPQVQFTALVERCVLHMTRFPNSPQLRRHRDLGATACPGAHFPWDKLRKEIELAMTPLPPIEDEGDCCEHEHWAEEYRQRLIDAGIAIHEKRFDDTITRGEVFALLGRVLNT